MIVPMKKVSLVLLESDRKAALKKLRKLGLVHINKVEGQSEKLSEVKTELESIEFAISLLSEYKVPKKLKFADLSTDEAVKKASEIVSMYERRKVLEDKIAAGRVELERLALWGEVNIEDLAYLASKDICFYLYEIENAKYLTLPETVKTMFVNRDKNTTRFLVLGEEGVTVARPEGLPPEAYSVTLPPLSTVQIKKDIVEYKAEIQSISKSIDDSLQYKKAILDAQVAKGKSFEFENLFAGMDRDDEGSFALAWLTGYIPTADMKALQELSVSEKWAVSISDPGEEDEVPTKLKNNAIVRMIYPVSDFLGTVPGYREYDISAWVLLFFTIFVGMIFGDAGYGAVMLLMAVFAMIGSAAKGKRVSQGVALLFLLGLATMVWGAVTCNWFGVKPELLPDVLRNLAWQPLSNDYASLSEANELWVKQNVQIFCFTLALVQLSVAHLKGMFRYIKSPKMLGELGSMLMVWGMYYVVLSMVVDGTRFPFDMPIPIEGLSQYPMLYAFGGCIGLGFFLSFVFSSYEGSLKDSILDSLKNIVSVLLGVINVFADIVSYIRLWAVGLAGSAISATVNDMAGPMLGGFVIFAGILLLVFGQGFNMVLNVLSVIVHGVRLNTLEFSNHLGMSWSGYSYEPFSED